MKIKTTTASLLSIMSILFISNSNAHANKGYINLKTTEGTALHTAIFETSKSQCTAVMLDPSTALTAAHCIDNPHNPSGKLYPGGSGIQTPAGDTHVTAAVIHPNPGKDLAILKGTPSKSSFYYLRDKILNIKTVTSSLAGQQVYTRGYPQSKRGRYQITDSGTVERINGDMITTFASENGQSGSGVFLQNTNELVGIIIESDGKNTHATPMTDDVKAWIAEQRKP